MNDISNEHTDATVTANAEQAPIVLEVDDIQDTPLDTKVSLEDGNPRPPDSQESVEEELDTPATRREKWMKRKARMAAAAANPSASTTTSTTPATLARSSTRNRPATNMKKEQSSDMSELTESGSDHRIPDDERDAEGDDDIEEEVEEAEEEVVEEEEVEPGVVDPDEVLQTGTLGACCLLVNVDCDRLIRVWRSFIYSIVGCSLG